MVATVLIGEGKIDMKMHDFRPKNCFVGASGDLRTRVPHQVPPWIWLRTSPNFAPSNPKNLDPRLPTIIYLHISPASSIFSTLIISCFKHNCICLQSKFFLTSLQIHYIYIMYMTWNCKLECTNDPMLNRRHLLPSTRVK